MTAVEMGVRGQGDPSRRKKDSWNGQWCDECWGEGYKGDKCNKRSAMKIIKNVF